MANGNYRKDYEIVQLSGKKDNNKNLVAHQGFTGTVQTTLFVSGAQQTEKVENLKSTEYIFVERFNAPGDVLVEHSLDKEAQEYSANNDINTRNYKVRKELLSNLTASCDKGLIIGTSVPSIHKVNKNTRYSTLDPCGADNDNGFISHQIPQSDNQYSWISSREEPEMMLTCSETERTSSYFDDDPGNPYGGNYAVYSGPGLNVFGEDECRWFKPEGDHFYEGVAFNGGDYLLISQKHKFDTINLSFTNTAGTVKGQPAQWYYLKGDTNSVITFDTLTDTLKKDYGDGLGVLPIISDETDNFTTEGTGSIVFYPPCDWTPIGSNYTLRAWFRPPVRYRNSVLPEDFYTILVYFPDGYINSAHYTTITELSCSHGKTYEVPIKNSFIETLNTFPTGTSSEERYINFLSSSDDNVADFTGANLKYTIPSVSLSGAIYYGEKDNLRELLLMRNKVSTPGIKYFEPFHLKSRDANIVSIHEKNGQRDTSPNSSYSYPENTLPGVESGERTVKNYHSVPIVNKRKPIIVHLKNGLDLRFSNNRNEFANDQLNEIYGLNQEVEEEYTPFEAFLDDPNNKNNIESIEVTETIFPQKEFMYCDETRRKNIPDSHAFRWGSDDPALRHSSSSYFYLMDTSKEDFSITCNWQPISSSKWVLDGIGKTTSSYFLNVNVTSSYYVDVYPGILNNVLSWFAGKYVENNKQRPQLPVYSNFFCDNEGFLFGGEDYYLGGKHRVVQDWSPLSFAFSSSNGPLAENKNLWEEDINKFKDHSVLQEYRDFTDSNKYIDLTLSPLFINYSLGINNEVSFETDELAVSDIWNQGKEQFDREIPVKIEKIDKNKSKIKIEIDSCLKIDPYKQFYPAERIVWILTNEMSQVDASMNDWFLEPLFSPGLFFNTLKSGVPCDWPIFNLFITGTTVPTESQFYHSFSSFTGSAENETFDGGIPRISSSVAYRIPFKTIFEPEVLEKRTLWTNIPHLSGNAFNMTDEGKVLTERQLVFNSTSTKAILQNYKKRIHNYVSNIMDLFVEEGVTFHISENENSQNFGNAVSGTQYKMRVELQPSNWYYQHGDLWGFSPGVTSSADYCFGHACACQKIGDADSREYCYQPYRPGICWADILFTASETKKYTLDEIMTNCSSSYTRFGVFSNELFQDYIGPGIENSMMITASVDLFNKITEKEMVYNKFGEIEYSSDSVSSGKRWVINTFLDVPNLRFDGDTGDGLTDEGYYKIFGLWHTPSIELKEYDENVYQHNKELQKTQNEDRSKLIINDITGFSSLADLVGFKKETKYIGRAPNPKKIKEAIMMVPFRYNNGIKEYIPLYKDPIKSRKVIDQLLGRKVEKQYEVKDSVVRMVESMKQYVIPPTYNFLYFDGREGKNEVSPFAIYFFEFAHEMSSLDLLKWWQNAAPRLVHEFETQKVVYEHELTEDDLLSSEDLTEDLQFEIFKVKYRGKKSYYKEMKLLLNSKIEDYEAEDTYSKEEYTSNWPYNYFSLIELAKVDMTITYSDEQNETQSLLDKLSSVKTELENTKKSKEKTIVLGNKTITKEKFITQTVESEDPGVFVSNPFRGELLK
jgi:hypothetical protein